MPTKTSELYLSASMIKELKDRLSRIEGHVSSIKGMLDRQENCNDILVQMSAIKAAVNQAMIKLLEGHMDVCVKGCIKQGDLDKLDEFKDAVSLVFKRS
ncbi:metal-sensitive transcriptional regulator [Candidatus Acetothermia bacterium]|nr:metal-sensitive transcriptional regulator [Candidatus Acetothermia bacterium]